ncbi:hypothetical protein BGZ94_005305 [Podila epigama]|nr:hypothetical protein BGZ94_005305 [Podila epigama]
MKLADDTSGFPKHQPKVGLIKPDPLAAFIIAKNDTFIAVDTKVPATTTATVPGRKHLLLDPVRPIDLDKRAAAKRQLVETLAGRPGSDRLSLSASPVFTFDSNSRSLHRRTTSESTSSSTSSRLRIDGSKPENVDMPKRYNGAFATMPSSPVTATAQPRQRQLTTEERIKRHGQDGAPRTALKAIKVIADVYTHSQVNRSRKLKAEAVKSRVAKVGKEHESARECLLEILHRLKDEHDGLGAEVRQLSLARLFETRVERVLTCLGCQKETVLQETVDDFCLNLAAVDKSTTSAVSPTGDNVRPESKDKMVHSESTPQSRSRVSTTESSTSRFSSRGLDVGSSSMQKARDAYVENSEQNPISLSSDEDELDALSASQIFEDSFTEEEQIKWALEESLRESQSSLGQSDLTNDCIDLTLNEEGSSASQESGGPIGELGGSLLNGSGGNGIGGEESDEEEDADIKAAILESLKPNGILPREILELNLPEKENLAIAEAIKQSLLEAEANKENYPLEEHSLLEAKKGQKKEQCGRSVSSVVEASSSEHRAMSSSSSSKRPLDKGSSPGHRKRNWSLREGEWSSFREDIQSNNRHHDATMEIGCEALDVSVLFELKAVVNHTGIDQLDQGHYSCDVLGTDAVWKSYDDDGEVSTIGSIYDLQHQRQQTAHLLFYTRRRS